MHLSSEPHLIQAPVRKGIQMERGTVDREHRQWPDKGAGRLL